MWYGPSIWPHQSAPLTLWSVHVWGSTRNLPVHGPQYDVDAKFYVIIVVMSVEWRGASPVNERAGLKWRIPKDTSSVVTKSWMCNRSTGRSEEWQFVDARIVTNLYGHIPEARWSLFGPGKRRYVWTLTHHLHSLVVISKYGGSDAGQALNG